MNEIEKAIQFLEESLVGAIAIGDVELVEVNKIALAALRKELEAQRNDALTLEKLREMGGEPVWAESLTSDKQSEWCILCPYPTAGSGRAEGWHEIFYIPYYGDEWLAYRRKPEVTP